MIDKILDHLAVLLIIFTFGIMPIFTFGYVAANTKLVEEGCKTCGRASLGLLAAVTYPLYWSWHLQENNP